MDLSLAISILSIVIVVISFFLNRKDKAVDDTKITDEKKANEIGDQKVINYRLGQVEVKLDKVLDILDGYDKEIDAKIEKAMEQHIKIYHREG